MIQTKQTLRQRLGTGIVLAAAGLGSLVTGGCAETQPVYKTPQQIQQEEQELQKAAGLAGSLFFGMAGSGAFDSTSRTAQQNLAVRGAAAGAQQYQTNDAIRNAGRNNENFNNQVTKYVVFNNLDTGQSVQIMGWDLPPTKIYIDSLIAHREDFPKKGYLFQKMSGNECLNSYHFTIKDLDKCEELIDKERQK